jgi:phosphoglycerate dehydrogenase-like enzyme
LPKVVLISDLPDDIKQAVLSYAPHGYETASISNRATDDEKLALTNDAEFIILYGGTISEALLKGSPRLKHVQLLSAGYDRIDLDLTARYNVPVSNNGGANAWAVAEATVAMILALYQRLIDADRFVREGRWRGDIQGFDTYELAGKTVGIVGLGNIGKKVARRLAPFETKLLYADAIADPAIEAELGLQRLDLRDLLPAVDVVTLHVPLLASTKGMMGASELALMKPTALFINTSRGDVVDEPALIDALQSKRLGGAGLDVFDQEPLPKDSPLLTMPNVVLSAHLAGTTYDTFFRRADFAFENIQGIAAGNAPMAVVSKG